MHPKTLITIDYLIINLKGMMTENKSTNSKFQFIASAYGTKTFANKFDVMYNNEKIGTLVNTPRSNIIPEDLNQLQFENHIFYTKSLIEIKTIIEELTDSYDIQFEAINRLDVAFDINDKKEYYRGLNSSLNDGSIRLSGRKKSFNQYNELIKGVCINNGFTLGQRSSSKMLRVYNKTLSLQIAEKPHIIQHYKNNNFSVEDVWRFEYQLNSSFFSNLKNFGHDKDFYDVAGEKLVLPFEDLTYSIFDYSVLVELVSMAQNNFFVLKSNTGKKQINAEETIPFILDFDYLKTFYGDYKPTIIRLKTTHVPNLTKRKRLAKALFREYCANFQNVTYVLALNRLLDEMNPFDNSPLHDWFSQKMPFYLAEFKDVEKMNNKFDFKLFDEQKKLFLNE
jgi:hypothetical protein